jgi:hypothetical protein
MKSRKAPSPVNYKRGLPAKLAYDPQVLKWTKRILGNAEAKPRNLNEQQLAFVHLEVMRRRADFSAHEGDLYLKAMQETCPVFAAPELERQKLAEDFELLFRQPEMRRFWDSWQGAKPKSGPTPDYHCAKALMATMAMSGISAHADDGFAELTGNAKLWKVFEGLAGAPKRPQSYENAVKQLKRLGCFAPALEANVAMIRELAKLYPGRGIGERLMIDGCLFPAWCEQKGKGKTEEEERRRRRFCPEAGPKAYIQRSGAKKILGGGDKVSPQEMKAGKFVRGYYLILIADQATGLPLVWSIVDANPDEAPNIVPALSDLYRLWPDCPAKLIAGDSAWDEDPWCRLCEVEYGIRPIFRYHKSSSGAKISNFSRKRKVLAQSQDGQLICATHRNFLDFKGSEHPGRGTLRPGQTNRPEGGFRVRGECPDGCGVLSMRMKADWNRLTYYPHFSTPGVGEERHAFRQAMLTRLNGIEGIFDRLQTGRKLATDGADRTRIRDKGAHESLISLALLSMTAAALADQRRQKSVPVLPLPKGGGAAPSAAPAPVGTTNGSGASASTATKTTKPATCKSKIRARAKTNGNGSAASSPTFDEVLAGVGDEVYDL